MGNNLILLTAAVTPDVAFGSSLSDPKERLRQYRSAIDEWSRVADASDCDLVTVETTGSGDSLRDQVRVVDFHAPEDTKQHGKGAVESAALDAAILACGLPDSSTVHKVTGRLTLRNAERLVAPLDNGARVRRTLDRTYCDTRFFSTNVKFWQTHLSGMANEVADDSGRYLEHVMAHRLMKAEYGGTAVQRFPERPMLLGVSGTTGKSYGTLWQRALSPVLLRVEGLLDTRLRLKQI
ncbi:hypothetical protein ACFVWT_01500 [Arthrobacter sp. NPDC058288]|uniref:hypothetical protein n=1 Tax=Arthrobacter sp. NPDC058288 TaxID=3346424 RepID=UPI0036E8CE19